MDVLGWSYPNEKSLRDLIEKHHLFPITTLSMLSQSQIQNFLDEDIVLARQLCDDNTLIDRLGLDDSKKAEAIKEAGLICSL